MVYLSGNEAALAIDHLSTSFPGAAPSYLYTCELINMASTAIR